MIYRTSLYLLIFIGFFSCNSVEKTDTKPDVLFIAIDDMNDWTGCLGGMPNSITPSLDRLASKSVLFSNAHCSAPACCPSRASVMTGVSPSTSGVYANQNEWRKYPALKNAKTIPEYFREL